MGFSSSDMTGDKVQRIWSNTAIPENAILAARFVSGKSLSLHDSAK